MTEEKALAWCCRCKAKQEFKEGTEKLKEVKTKNGKTRSFLTGLCKVCECKMCRILPKEKNEKEDNKQ